MIAIGVRELRQNASKYLERVKRGESIEVTDRGVLVAMLVPVPVEKKSRYQEMVEQGLIAPGRGDLQDFLRANPPMPMELGDGAPSTARILDELRDERL